MYINTKKRACEIYCSLSWQSLLRKRFAQRHRRALPIVVKKESRNTNTILETPLPLDALMDVAGSKPRTQDYFYVLVDETDLPNGFIIPFRNRAIPGFYEDEEIRNMT